MDAAPDATPVTTPVVPIVAVAVVLLLHTPPVVTSANDVKLPAHTVCVPVMAAGVAGNGLTVTMCVAATVPQLLVTV